MAIIQHSNIADSDSSDLNRLNFEELRKQLTAVYSRQNAAVNMRAVSADTTITYKDSMVFVDTSGGNVTITLAPANSWGTSKSPKISIIKTSESNTLTVAAGSGDTLNYWSGGASIITGSVTTAGVLDLVSDGSTKWFALSGIGASLVPKYARLQKSTAQATLTADTLISWQTTNLSGFSIASDVLTVSAGSAGLYRIDVCLPFTINTTVGEGYFGYKLNSGSTVFMMFKEPYAADAGETFIGSFYLNLADSDTLEFRISENTAGSISLNNSGSVTVVQVTQE